VCLRRMLQAGNYLSDDYRNRYQRRKSESGSRLLISKPVLSRCFSDVLWSLKFIYVNKVVFVLNEMDDDFEYYITFPVIAEPVVSKEPVIILFGWAGCVDRYLAKYSEIYQKKGCTTIRYITSPNVVSPRCIDEKKIHNLAGNVINLLLDMKFDKHPIFFHVFSNGGATVYRYVSELMKKKHPNDFQVKIFYNFFFLLYAFSLKLLKDV
ncbi:Transmembrane protein 53, partial [Araneus ventricosus]